MRPRRRDWRIYERLQHTITVGSSLTVSSFTSPFVRQTISDPAVPLRLTAAVWMITNHTLVFVKPRRRRPSASLAGQGS